MALLSLALGGTSSAPGLLGDGQAGGHRPLWGSVSFHRAAAANLYPGGNARLWQGGPEGVFGHGASGNDPVPPGRPGSVWIQPSGLPKANASGALRPSRQQGCGAPQANLGQTPDQGLSRGGRAAQALPQGLHSQARRRGRVEQQSA